MSLRADPRLASASTAFGRTRSAVSKQATASLKRPRRLQKAAEVVQRFEVVRALFERSPVVVDRPLGVADGILGRGAAPQAVGEMRRNAERGIEVGDGVSVPVVGRQYGGEIVARARMVGPQRDGALQ